MNKDTDEIVYSYFTDRTASGSVPHEGRGTYRNNSQNYTWDKQAQSNVLVNNDVIRIGDIEKECVLRMTILEITKQSAKQGGGEISNTVLECKHDLSADSELLEKLKHGQICQHTIEIDCGGNTEVKMLACTLNFFYDLYKNAGGNA